MADILKEVEEEMREERTSHQLKQYGIAFAISAVIAVTGTAAWQWWQAYNNAKLEAVGDQYYQATVHEYNQNTDKALSAYQELQGAGVPTIAQMATLKRSLLLLEQGEAEQALQQLQQLQGSGETLPEFKQLASLISLRLKANANGLADADVAALETLAAEEGIFRYSAKDMLAFYFFDQGNVEQASALFSDLSIDPEVPVGISQRATEMINNYGLKRDFSALLPEGATMVSEDVLHNDEDNGDAYEYQEENAAEGVVQ